MGVRYWFLDFIEINFQYSNNAWQKKRKKKKNRVVKRGIMCCVYYNMHAHYSNIEKQCVLLDRLIVHIYIYIHTLLVWYRKCLYTFWVSGCLSPLHISIDIYMYYIDIQYGYTYRMVGNLVKGKLIFNIPYKFDSISFLLDQMYLWVLWTVYVFKMRMFFRGYFVYRKKAKFKIEGEHWNSPSWHDKWSGRFLLTL